MGRVTRRRPVRKVSAATGEQRLRADTLVVEEPLEIRIGARPLSVTMRTPGDDFDLVIGFLHGEGIVRGADDISEIRYCDGTRTPPGTSDAGDRYNIVEVALAEGVPLPEPDRSFVMTSACGVCGKTSIDSVRQRGRHDIAADTTRLDPLVLAALPDALRRAQRVFDRTGGLHAAGLFEPGGAPLAIREDVGRHNAVDKVVGWAVRRRLDLRGHVLVVSGRASFELTQKAMMAGIPALVAVSAPSSLAVDLAQESGMTLAGFVRGGTMNLYTGSERVGSSALTETA